MTPTGYSGTPLIKKLGIGPQVKLLLIDAPGNYTELLQTNIENQLVTRGEVPDLVHLFAKTNAAFIAGMKKILPLCKKNPGIIIWVSWYKKSAGIITDLTEDIIRSFALKHGLVDIKVCAVTEAWSGLKLMVPLAKR